jgi:hypothetical protein
MLSGLAAPVLPRLLLLQQTLENELYNFLRVCFPDRVYQPSSSLIDSTLLADWLAGHGPHESGAVRYILDPWTVVPPRGPFGFSNLFVVTGEGHLTWFPVTYPFSLIRKPSLWSFKAAQLFVPPRNRPWWESHPGWTVLVIGQDDGLLQHVNSQLYIPHPVYSSWYKP